MQILSSEGRVVRGESEHRTGTDAMMALLAAIPLIHLLLLLSAPSVEASNVHVSHLREDHRQNVHIWCLPVEGSPVLKIQSGLVGCSTGNEIAVLNLMRVALNSPATYFPHPR